MIGVGMPPNLGKSPAHSLGAVCRLGGAVQPQACREGPGV